MAWVFRCPPPPPPPPPSPCLPRILTDRPSVAAAAEEQQCIVSLETIREALEDLPDADERDVVKWMGAILRCGAPGLKMGTLMRGAF